MRGCDFLLQSWHPEPSAYPVKLFVGLGVSFGRSCSMHEVNLQLKTNYRCSPPFRNPLLVLVFLVVIAAVAQTLSPNPNLGPRVGPYSLV